MSAKKTRKSADINVPDAILSSDSGKRLDAIIRRHGGKPKPAPGAKVALPPLGKWGEIEDQMTLDEALPEPPL